MSRYVDLDERVTAQFYDQECEEWTMQTVTIEDVLDSVCDEYTALPSAEPETHDKRTETHECVCERTETHGDFISRKAAIDAIHGIYQANNPKQNDDMDKAVMEIIKLPSAEPERHGRWIPCSERLPEIIKGHHVSDVCIVYCDTGAYGFTILEENIFGQVGWQCERDDDYHEPLGEVIAWMTLPEPWKGEKDGN